MSDSPDDQAKALVATLAGLKANPLHRSLGVAVITNVSSDAMTSTAQNNQQIGQSTIDRLAVGDTIKSKKARKRFRETTLVADETLMKANAQLAAVTAKLTSRY